MKTLLPFILLSLTLWSCNPGKKKNFIQNDKLTDSGLTARELEDKILGMLVGAAIGDAMGAPTEMWSREDILLEYGFVQQLDSMVREVSAEGIWVPNLPAGGTTDDTRWKVLTTEYLLSQQAEVLEAKDFAKHIVDRYTSYVNEFSEIESIDSKPFEQVNLKMGWLQEWAKVSQPFMEDNLKGYVDSLGKFYGGEMVCAGLLYAPTLGAYFPGNPKKAYEEAYKLSIYDLGYAKDLTSLSAAMTAAGMKNGASGDSLLAALRLDPANYYESRLVGRTAHRILRDALWISTEAKKVDSAGNYLCLESPSLQSAFAHLDRKLQDMPFHAGEIYLQTLTAMIYTDFDFMGTLIFLTNYGRDNDTTAALAGGILGAYYGFEKLPEKERNQVLKVNKEILKIDLLETGKSLSKHILS